MGEDNKRGIGILLVVVGVILLIGALTVVLPEVQKSKIYENAQDLFNRGKYEEAAEEFGRVRGYSDADEMIVECGRKVEEVKKSKIYDNAQNLFDEGKYEEAAEEFEKVSGYSDADEKVKKSWYKAGGVYYNRGDYEDAARMYEKASGYNNAVTMHDDSWYMAGQKYYNKGYYNNAKRCFESIKHFAYKDSESYILLCRAHDSTLSDEEVQSLFDMLDFEDTIEIIENNEWYFIDFLVGEWTSHYTDYYFKMKHNDEGGYTAQNNFPGRPEGEYFYIENGIYKLGNDSKKTDFLKLSIVDKDTLWINCIPINESDLFERQ